MPIKAGGSNLYYKDPGDILKSYEEGHKKGLLENLDGVSVIVNHKLNNKIAESITHAKNQIKKDVENALIALGLKEPRDKSKGYIAYML